jgi:hypothetical protein
VYWCGREPSPYYYGGADAYKRGDGEEEKSGDVAAALPHAVALVEAPIAYWCGGAEERRGCGDDTAAMFTHAVAPVEALSAATAGLHG